MTLFPINFFLT
jgi:hypothetical protein